MRLVPFAYTCTTSRSGYVPAEAVATFKAKDTAVANAMRTQQEAAGRALTLIERDYLLVQSGRIIRANRTSARNGWFFYTPEQAKHLAELGRAELAG